MRARTPDRISQVNLVLGAGVLLGLALALAAADQWHAARALQRQHDVAWAVRELQALAAPLPRWPEDRALRTQVEQRVAAPAQGFAEIEVRDARDLVLLRSGRYDHDARGLPESLRAAWQRLRYALVSHAGTARLSAADGSLLASVQFRLLNGRVSDVNPAVTRLRRGAGAVCALGLVLAAGFGYALRRRLRPGIDWAQRLDRHRLPIAGVEDIEDLESRVREATRTRVGRVLDGVHYALIVVARDGRILFVNDTAEQLTGWTQAEARDRPVYSVFHTHGEDGVTEITPVENCLREGEDIPPQLRWLRSRRGQARPIEVMAALLRDPEGLVEGAAMMFRDMSVVVQQQDDLRRQARLSQGVVDHLDEGLLTTDPAGVVRFANARAQRMFGYAREEMDGVTVTKLMPVPFLNTPDVRISDYIGARGNDKLPKVVGWRKDATTFPAELWVQPMNVDGSSGLVVIVRDITERLRSENLASRLGRLLDSASEEIYIFDAQTLYFLEVNRGAQRNLGYRPEQLAGMTPLQISEELDATTFQSYLARLRGGDTGPLSYRCRHRRADGSSYPVEVRLNFSREEEPPVFMAIAADISERQAAEERLHQLAHFDSLTGLPNRNVLNDRLDQALLAAARSTRMVGVFFIDLDRFKDVNDRHGHDVGDQVLRTVADRLRQCLRSSDTVARLGGDEFVIVAQGLRASEDAARLAQKILDRFTPPMDIDGLQLRVTPSIGIVLYPLVEADAEGLLRYADSAMYQSKQAGRARYQIFEEELAPERRRAIELQREAHTAIALNQLRLRLRPVLTANDGALAGTLLGVVWKHPRYGLIGAEEASAAAHRAGVLADLELWTLYRGCELHAAATGRGAELPPMLAEIAIWQLRTPDFGRALIDLLDRYQLPGRQLLLALYGVAADEALTQYEAVRSLLERGVRFGLRLDAPAVAGAGADLPLRVLLLDGGSTAEGTLAEALALGQRLQSALLLTGVGDEAQLAQVQASGADYLSGEALEPEIAARELERFCASRVLRPL